MQLHVRYCTPPDFVSLTQSQTASAPHLVKGKHTNDSFFSPFCALCPHTGPYVILLQLYKSNVQPHIKDFVPLIIQAVHYSKTTQEAIHMGLTHTYSRINMQTTQADDYFSLPLRFPSLPPTPPSPCRSLRSARSL